MKLTWYPYGNAKIGSCSFAIHVHAQDIGNVLPKLSQEPVSIPFHVKPLREPRLTVQSYYIFWAYPQFENAPNQVLLFSH